MVLITDSSYKTAIRYFLLTARQPVPLKYEVRNGKTTVFINTAESFCEGQACICCIADNNCYYYPLQLIYRVQDKIVKIKKDYRSPKTVNPDSSLLQQRILFNMDNQRILLPLTGAYKGETTPFFYSDSIELAPVTATYLVDPDAPVTSIYVQPGTNASLNFTARYDSTEKIFLVQTQQLTDSHRNIVADGTLVAFLYSDGITSNRIEAAVHHGVATAKIVATENKPLTIRAVINDFYSSSKIVAISK